MKKQDYIELIKEISQEYNNFAVDYYVRNNKKELCPEKQLKIFNEVIRPLAQQCKEGYIYNPAPFVDKIMQISSADKKRRKLKLEEDIYTGYEEIWMDSQNGYFVLICDLDFFNAEIVFKQSSCPYVIRNMNILGSASSFLKRRASKYTNEVGIVLNVTNGDLFFVASPKILRILLLKAIDLCDWSYCRALGRHPSLSRSTSPEVE